MKNKGIFLMMPFGIDLELLNYVHSILMGKKTGSVSFPVIMYWIITRLDRREHYEKPAESLHGGFGIPLCVFNGPGRVLQ